MAINLKDFQQTKYPNLFKSKTKDKTKGYKYLMWIKIDGKLYKKILGYSETDKLTDKKAKDILEEFKRDLEAGYNLTTKTTLNKLYELYFETIPDTEWKKIKQSIYRRYIEKKIGKKSISDIKPMQIKKIINDLDKKGLSPRTQKSILEVLKPMFRFAIENKMIKENPTQYINVKIPNQKRVVTNATELFNRIYNGIKTYYEDEPFYQALFLFAFTGRRKSEILNLKWENIDFQNNYYWITNTKNNDNQKYPLPEYIKNQLLKFKEKKGLVFKSPKTGKTMQNIDRQMRQLKKFIGIENLSMHYMRNILVSMLAEQQTEAIILSGILGHKDVTTINKYLSINHFKSGKKGLTKINEILEAEVIE